MSIPKIVSNKNGNITINTTPKIKNNTTIQNQNNQTQNNTEIKENNNKEYSIEQFQKDYTEILNNKVLAILGQYEDERKQKHKIALLSVIITVILSIIIFILLTANGVEKCGKILELAGIVAAGIWFSIKKSFENKIKMRVLPLLMMAIPGFKWNKDAHLSDEEIINSQIANLPKRSKGRFDDCFVGKYRNVPISITECRYGSDKHTIFSGVIIKIKMNKTIEGTTIIRPAKINIKDLKKAKYQKVELEDVNFNKLFQVYGTDQVEARYLLTTSFMERLKNITLAFNADNIYCSFKGDSVYIAPFCTKDLFSIGSLTKPITDTAQFQILFEEFVSILELVDHFKLDKKLGL